MEENIDVEAKDLDRIENEDEEFNKSLEENTSRDKVILSMKELSILGHEAQRQKRLENRRKAAAIKRAAFDQKLINLVDPIPMAHMHLLLDVLTEKRRGRIDTCYAFIHKRLAFCLNPLIPKMVKKCRELYPKSMAVNPGFMYEASEEYGGGNHLWVNPDVPLYFDQDEVMDILYKYKAPFLPAVDKAVKKYVKESAELVESRVILADKLASLKEQNYFELLKAHPIWFDALYNKLNNQKEKL